MAWTNKKGFNFRSTLAYDTDGTNETAVVPATATLIGPTYPTNVTVDGDNFDYGYTVGGESLDGSRNRNSALDARLAGVHFALNDGTNFVVFRVDVPAGTYTINLAIGDASNNPLNQYIEIFDNATSRVILSNLDTSGTSQWFDASGVRRDSEALWLANQTAVTGVSISSGILKVQIGSPTNVGDVSALSHLAITKESGGASNVPRAMAHYRRMRA